MPAPWRTLSRLHDVVVCWQSSLPGTKHVATDGRRNIIWIRKGLTQAQRWCALQHELIHLEHQHTTCQNAELLVRREAARRLITTTAFFDTGVRARNLHEWAEEVWVTIPVLRPHQPPLPHRTAHRSRLPPASAGGLVHPFSG